MAAVTFPMCLLDPVAAVVTPLLPGLLWHCVLAMQDDWGAEKVNDKRGETNTKKGDCNPGL